MQLHPGDPAPDFLLGDHDGATVALGDLRGRRVILYFYPKDDTPGCTKEACQFNDSLDRFSDLNVTILGVSGDDGQSHRRFRSKFSLRFPLLTDPDHLVAKAYGAHGDKSLYGRLVTGTIRSAFLISETGRIEQAWYNVRADGHPAAILDGLA